MAAGQPRAVGRPGAEPGGAARRRARARADRLRCRRLLGHRADDGDVTVVRRDPRRRRRAPCRHRQGLRLVGPTRRRRRRPRRADGTFARRRPRAGRVRRPQRRGQAVPLAAEGAVHDVDAAAGGRPAAALVVVAGDARRPGPVRARLHHVHAHRRRGAVRRGAAGRAGGDHQRVRRDVPVAVAAPLHVAGEERPGSPRGDPPDDAVALAAAARRRAQRPRAGAVPADLAAHAGQPDGRRHRPHRHRAHRRHRHRRSRRRVLRLGNDDHVPRLPPGLRRGPRRGRRRDGGDRARGAAASAGDGRRRRRRIAGAPWSRHHAAAALHRGVARQAPRGARHRPPVDVGVDHPDDPGPRLRVEEGPGARADVDGVRRRRPARAALRRARRLRLHRQGGDRSRRHRRRPAEEGRMAARVLLRRGSRPATTPCPGSSASSRRTSTASTRRRSTRSRSATTPTATSSSSSRAATARTSSAATTRPACPTTSRPTS